MGDPAYIGTSNISFSGLRAAWSATGYAPGSDPGGGSNSNISLSEFRGATFTTGPSVPDDSDEEISINDDFKGRTFASGAITYATGSFKVYDSWSAYPSTPKKLTHGNGNSSHVGSSVANKRAKLLSGQTSSSYYNYPIMLFTPGNPTSSSDLPGLVVGPITNLTSNNQTVSRSEGCIDEATLWLKVVAHNSYNAVQFGIVKKDSGLSWSSQLQYLDDYHATYKDRLTFHGRGYHNYAGSRDDIDQYSSEEIDGGLYGSTLTTLFHNRNQTTGGTEKSNPLPATVNSAYYFFKANWDNYSGFRGSSNYSHVGLKLKWYETTIQANVTDGESWIVPGDGETYFSSLSDVFAGMYISGPGIPANTFIGEVHTKYIRLYDELSSNVANKDALADGTNVTLTVNGYLYWTLGSLSAYNSVHIMGPPHTVLPRIQEVSTETTEWAFFIGDTTSSTTNTFSYDIRNTDPGSAFTYSDISYTPGTVPTSGGATGVYMNSSYLSSGNRGSSQVSSSIDLSSSSYYGSSVIGLDGHIVLKYKSGGGWASDFQLDNITINGSYHHVGKSSGTYRYSQWERGPIATANQTYPTTWANVASNSPGNGYWMRDLDGTSSSYTGKNMGSDGCIYFEASNPGFPNKVGYLRSPETTFTSNNVTLYYYAYSWGNYSSYMGTLYAGVEIV